MIDGLPATCDTPGETACEGRLRRTCGADHMWDPAQDHTCDYTCADGACVRPSNILAADVAACTASVLAPAAGTTVTLTSTGGVHLDCNPDCGAPGVTQIMAADSTAELAWFCLSRLDLPAGMSIDLPATNGPAQAIVLFVDGSATIGGRIAFDGGGAGPGGAGGEGAPGGFDGGARVSSAAGNPGDGTCAGSG